jgi:hypothetical protein
MTPTATQACAARAISNANDFINQANAVGGALTDQEEAAIRQLYCDLDVVVGGTNIYDELSEFYPMIGANLASQGLRGRNPVGGTPISWTGTFSITSSGITATSDGSFGDTGISHATINKPGMGTYVNSANVSKTLLNGDMGLRNEGFPRRSMLQVQSSGSMYGAYLSPNTLVSSASGGRGLFQIARFNPFGIQKGINGSYLGEESNVQTTASSGNFYITCVNNVGVGATTYTQRRYAWFHFGAIPDFQIPAFYNAVQNYQIALGRNV